MRSKVTKIILSETSEQTKEKVRNYANNLINKKMKIEDNCVEYRHQQHEMLVEGTADFKPTENEIMEHGAKKGFFVSDIEIWFDRMQGFWRWSGNIIRLT